MGGYWDALPLALNYTSDPQFRKVRRWDTSLVMDPRTGIAFEILEGCDYPTYAEIDELGLGPDGENL